MRKTTKLLFVYDKMLEKFTPRAYAHLERMGVNVALFATQWFVTVFTYNFPFELVVRVWDQVRWARRRASVACLRLFVSLLRSALLYYTTQSTPSHHLATPIQFLFDGWKPVFRVAIAIIGMNEELLRNMSMEDFMTWNRFLPSKVDCSELLEAALKVRLKTSDLEELFALYDKEKAAGRVM